MEGEWRSENYAKLFDNVVKEWLHVSDNVDLVIDTIQPPELHLLFWLVLTISYLVFKIIFRKTSFIYFAVQQKN